jgi:hypothetical protein
MVCGLLSCLWTEERRTLLIGLPHLGTLSFADDSSQAGQA